MSCMYLPPSLNSYYKNKSYVLFIVGFLMHTFEKNDFSYFLIIFFEKSILIYKIFSELFIDLWEKLLSQFS